MINPCDCCKLIVVKAFDKGSKGKKINGPVHIFIDLTVLFGVWYFRRGWSFLSRMAAVSAGEEEGRARSPVIWSDASEKDKIRVAQSGPMRRIRMACWSSIAHKSSDARLVEAIQTG